jgi:Uma2 family endonuclease
MRCPADRGKDSGDEMTAEIGALSFESMQELVFESTRTLSQEAFSDWVLARPRWDLHHYELLNGRVVMTPPAGYPHGEIESNVHTAIAAFVKAGALGKVLGSSQGFELPSGDTVEPDVTFVSRERWAAGPAPENGRFLRIVPDLVVEIASPSTASHDRTEKKRTYEQNGVREYWIVDHDARQITIFVLDGEQYAAGRVFREPDAIESTALAGIALPVREIFPSG